MANSDKNILITPNRNLGGLPEIAFTGAGNSSISIVADDSSTSKLNFVSSGSTVFSISADISSTNQVDIGSNGNSSLSLSQGGDILLNSQKIIIEGKGIKLPKITPTQSSSIAGKIAYDSNLKTLVVNDSKSWVNYGPAEETYIQNGLILYYDASRKDSYPGSGTNVFDISGSSVGGSPGTAAANSGSLDGTMSNVGFSTSQGGAFSFNGSNSYIDIGNSTDLLKRLSAYTIEYYVRIEQALNSEIFGNYGSGYTTDHLWISARYGQYINTNNPYFAASDYTSAYPLPTTYTYHTAVTRDYSSSRGTVLYLNGILNNTSGANINIANDVLYRIGTDTGGTGEPFGGLLYAIRVYNRALTPKEIQMNFNATKGRVGL
jgi:hypothetical protein